MAPQPQPSEPRKTIETLSATEPLRFGHQGIVLLERKQVREQGGMTSRPFLTIARGEEFRNGVRVSTRVTLPENLDVLRGVRAWLDAEIQRLSAPPPAVPPAQPPAQPVLRVDPLVPASPA